MADDFLFEAAEIPEIERDVLRLQVLKTRLWTANKARLVSLYLKYFVFITKHGCYIDGFSGPKDPAMPESWAAKLVIESEPKFLREFRLCELDARKVTMLRQLVADQAHDKKRIFSICHGDFNKNVDVMLRDSKIGEKTASFCLIDQYALECDWETVNKIAAYKKQVPKIEIFYFFPTGWLERALTQTKDESELVRWWGPDWNKLLDLRRFQRMLYVCERFKTELGYQYAHPWPIYKEGNAGRIMFHMIHATDHPEAPKLMWRAYHRARLPDESPEQLEFPLRGYSAMRDDFDA